MTFKTRAATLVRCITTVPAILCLGVFGGSSALAQSRGADAFAANCAACHGADAGGGPSGPALNGAAFDIKWRGRSLEDLAAYIAGFMPPASPGVLGAKGDSDTAAYLMDGLRSRSAKFAQAAEPQPAAAVADVQPLPRASPTKGIINKDAVYAAADAAKTARLAAMRPVDDIMLKTPPAGDWLIWRRSYDGLGYSPLTQIGRTNVASLATAWSWSLAPGANEITPLVHDGVLFINSGMRVQALDATNGELLWEHVRPASANVAVAAPSSKNMAIFEDKLFVATSDRHVVALNFKTGAVVWDHVVIGDENKGAKLTGGPIVVRGKVIQGASLCQTLRGGCYIVALDARTGDEAWRFYTIARPGTKDGDTWNGAPVNERYGGAVWTSGSYDPQLNLLYFGIGQTYDTATLLAPRPGKSLGANDALYTNSTVALDPDTGKLAWRYQHFNRDVWDFDWVFERSLVDLTIKGKPVKASITMGKLGILDAIDRTNGKYLFSTDFGVQNLVSAIDPVTGRKTVAPALQPEANKTKLVCPHAGGARAWAATAYNPRNKILYAPLNESCMDFTWTPRSPEETASGGSDIGWFLKPPPGSDGLFGRVQALNLETRKMVWTKRARAQESSALLATAGGILFDGSRDRWFHARDEDTGEILWQTRLNAQASSFPITYSVGDKQYIAVVAGGGNAHDLTWQTLTPEIEAPTGPPVLWVFTLPKP